MKKTIAQMIDEFDEFEVEIPMLLEDLENLLKRSVNHSDFVLKYDLETLDKVEDFYLSILNKKIKIDISEERMGRLLIAYFGELFIHLVGGRWAFCDLKGDTAYGTPIILGWGKPNEDTIRISPVESREHLKNEKRNFILRDVIEYFRDRDSIMDDLFKDWK